MVGKNAIQITGNQFAQGLATSDYLGDGSIGVSSQNINPLVTQGVLYASSPLSASGLSDALVATYEDYENPVGANRWAVGTSQIYYLDIGGTVHNPFSGSAGFVQGVTDMAAFDKGDGTSAMYITLASDIGQIRGSITGVGGNALGYGEGIFNTRASQSLVSGVPHPLLVYNNFLWIGDGQNLHNFTTGGSANKNVLTLDKNEEIFAFGIDPQTGLMMISARSVATGTNGSIPAKNYIYLYDGYSSKARNKIAVSGTVFSLTTVGGSVFAGIDNSIGVWNGKGITFLRRLSSTSSIPYKHRCMAVNNLFMVADAGNVLCYGDILNGKKAWFPLYNNTENGNSINVIFQQSLGEIGVSYNTSTIKFIELFDQNFGPGPGIFYTNKINFERPVFINRIRVVTTGITTTAGLGGVAFIDEKNVTHTTTVSTFVVPSAASPKYVFDFDYGGTEVQTIQPKITLDTQSFGIVKIIIYYTVAE